MLVSGPIFHLDTLLLQLILRLLVLSFLRLPAFFPSFAVVAVDIAVLAHAVGVELAVWAVPGFFVAAVLVVAVVAHAFGVVFAIGVSAAVDLLADSSMFYIFFFPPRVYGFSSTSSCFGCLSCSRC